MSNQESQILLLAQQIKDLQDLIKDRGIGHRKRTTKRVPLPNPELVAQELTVHLKNFKLNGSSESVGFFDLLKQVYINQGGITFIARSGGVDPKFVHHALNNGRTNDMGAARLLKILRLAGFELNVVALELKLDIKGFM